MGPTNVYWRDLTLGFGTDYRIDTVEGWEERPAGRYTNVSRTRAHGSHRSAVYADERIVTVTGWAFSPEQRDELLLALQGTFGYDDGDTLAQLAIGAAGRDLYADAQLLRAVPSMNRGQWGAGWFGWLLQWRCPEPYRYTPNKTATPVGLPVSGGGLTYPLTYPLSYGGAATTGQMTLTNAGTAPAPIVFTVRGDLPVGAEIIAVATGKRLTYSRPIPGNQRVAISTGPGTVMVEGTSSRRAALTSADWLHVPARSTLTGKAGELTVQFSSLGGAYSANAQLFATMRDTYW